METKKFGDKCEIRDKQEKKKKGQTLQNKTKKGGEKTRDEGK